jgi:hypothetical protein
MKRVHVVEFEDLSWFPAWLRNCMTNVLVVFVRMVGASNALAALISRISKEQNLKTVVDLGSGGGGIMPDVLEKLRSEPATRETALVMTDLYPNADALERFNNEETPYIRYLSSPVDAADLSSGPDGLKTMVNSFHHMRPEVARSILKSAHDARQPLLIYELAESRLPFPLWLIGLAIGLPLVALMCMLLTPFVRPLTAKQLFFTYVVPIIPLFFAWDGQASMPRLYSFDDMDELLDGLNSRGYRWEKGHAMEDGKRRGTYLLGLPTAP